MDKIKILAAALALAGCMENGMGMEENEISGHNVIIRSLENDKLEKIIEESGLHNISSVTFDSIDFSEEYNEELLNEFLYEKSNVIFNKCNYFPENMYGIQHVYNISFNNCNMSLESACDFICHNCTLDYVRNLTYKHDIASMSQKGITYKIAVDYFGMSVYVN